MATLHNSGLVPSTASVPLPRYAASRHYIQHVLPHFVDMPYSYNSWRIKFLKDELEQKTEYVTEPNSISSMFPIISFVGKDKQTATCWTQSIDGSAPMRVIATSPASPVVLIGIGPIYGWFIDFYLFEFCPGVRCRILRDSV